WDRRISFEVDCGLQKWSVVISFFWPLLEAVKKPKRFQERQRFLGRNANYFYTLFLLFVW
ncbi:MAG: hypothetical protein QGI86_19950, partial [Candidatus Poribacteria bacterium]|nr:hypothetical protein [Candidatus Poribacteria bacterium]